MLNLMHASDFIFNPFNVQNLNFMGAYRLVLGNVFPLSKVQERQSKKKLKDRLHQKPFSTFRMLKKLAFH